MVLHLAALELNLIKAFTIYSVDAGPEEIHRADCYLVLSCGVNVLAILREIALLDVTVTLQPTFKEFSVRTELLASKEGVRWAVAPASVTTKLISAINCKAVKVVHSRVVGPDQLDN